MLIIDLLCNTMDGDALWKAGMVIVSFLVGAVAMGVVDAIERRQRRTGNEDWRLRMKKNQEAMEESMEELKTAKMEMQFINEQKMCWLAEFGKR